MNFSNTVSFARGAAHAALLRLGSLWRRRAQITALVLVLSLSANCACQGSAARPRPEAVVPAGKGAAIVAGVVAPIALIGVGVYFILQQAHTVTGCVTDDPDHLLLHLDNGKTYVLLGATTKIKAGTRIKVRGTRKKKIPGISDQPSFVVEKLNKVYGPCSASPANP